MLWPQFSNRKQAKAFLTHSKNTLLSHCRWRTSVSGSVGSKYLIMETGIGKFKLLPVDQNQFFPEDIRTPVSFQKAEGEEKKYRVVSVYNEKRKVDQVIFYY